MHASNALAVLIPNTYVVKCVFNTGRSDAKEYSYLTDIPEIKRNDWVIVMAPDFDAQYTGTSKAPRIPKAVCVISVGTLDDIDITGDLAFGWVVQKVDTTAHESRQADIVRLQAAINAKKAQSARDQLKQALCLTLGMGSLDDIQAVIGSNKQE